MGGWDLGDVDGGSHAPAGQKLAKHLCSAFEFDDTRDMRWGFPVELQSFPAAFIISLASCILNNNINLQKP